MMLTTSVERDPGIRTTGIEVVVRIHEIPKLGRFIFLAIRNKVLPISHVIDQKVTKRCVLKTK